MGLETYRQKRDFARTPEPSGKVRKKTGWSFVVQKHAASRMHYDFRLELDGVLLSWSVPKGPSYDVEEKRLAVQTEDHPVEYGTFEGIIPEGEYGGGTVMLWDRGTWEPVGDPRVGMEKGKLDFVLHGERLEGRWTLVRLKSRPEDRGRANWLLFKRSDEHVAEHEGEEITDVALTSVKSGRSMDEIAEAKGRSRKVWHSNRGSSEGVPSAKARIRAAAREGRVKHAAKTVRAPAEPVPSEPAKKKKATKKPRAHTPPRKWDVAPREGAYRGPTRAPRRDTGAREKVAGVGISNGGRVVDPGSGITKIEVARYYAEVAHCFLAHAADRALALVRCPEGSAGQCFYQKHSHPGMSEHIHVAHAPWGEEVLSVRTQPGVVALAQWSAIELHGWSARVDAIEKPDWIVMDLDPAEDVGFAEVVEGALTLRERLSSIGLESFVKTTGGKGLHVVVPLMRRHGWDVVKDFAHALALDISHRAPDRYLAEMSKSKRTGRIFVDYLRNGRGNTAILPYSARARDGLPVAMPLAWSEIEKVTPAQFDVRSAPKWIAKRRRDPWAAMRSVRQSITREILDALAT
ncbi:non-homologous end-joining DNA ligase [Sandaracinus amylolyticus]|uniref:ATP-dependent DNA ligase n=1 Tax=Sandaracinus amylolyticus TaxID=927083 RepID=A0A0F6YKP4_9BACT|nr:non-homologous end-joining DNA ligase [Sandaracinus amylolyticus]AKF08607.1 ATP-dependent DNA ligase [Sandaracinus amylolyticus]